MLAIAIHSLEVLTLLLIGIMTLRIRTLVSADSEFGHLPDNDISEGFDEAIFVAPTTPQTDYELKMQCLKLAQAFAGNQMLDIRREFAVGQSEQPDWLRQAVSLYLIGAIDFIGKQKQCETKSRKELIEIVLKSNLKINRDKAKAFFVEAVCREPKSDNDTMVIAGAQAAKSWLENKLVPENYCLRTRVQDWGVLA